MSVILRFSGSRSLISKAIQWQTWSWVSHVEFELDGKLYGALPGIGVAFRNILSTNRDRVERYLVDVPRFKERRIIEAALSQQGKPYDYLAIVGFLARQNWRSEDKWFCSDFKAWCFEKGEEPLLRSDQIERFSPRDIYMSPRLKRIPNN